MSNEYYDWRRDHTEEAKEWVAKYPFLRIKDNRCCPWESTEEITSCWMFDLPVGWYDLGAKMCDRLMAALGKYADDFIILQLKEKFNEIRLYWNWADREYTDEEAAELNSICNTVADILDLYAKLSYHTCVDCGKPATKWTKSYIASYCDDCFKRRYEHD